MFLRKKTDGARRPLVQACDSGTFWWVLWKRERGRTNMRRAQEVVEILVPVKCATLQDRYYCRPPLLEVTLQQVLHGNGDHFSVLRNRCAFFPCLIISPDHLKLCIFCRISKVIWFQVPTMGSFLSREHQEFSKHFWLKKYGGAAFGERMTIPGTAYSVCI